MAHAPLDALIEAARSYLGVPFRHAGRDRNGVDCVGLILAAARESGMFDYQPRGYARGDSSRLVAEVERFAVEVETEPEAGCLLLLECRGEVTHCALVSERDTILHADERRGRVVEQRLQAAIRRRVVRCYRWREEPPRQSASGQPGRVDREAGVRP